MSYNGILNLYNTTSALKQQVIDLNQKNGEIKTELECTKDSIIQVKKEFKQVLKHELKIRDREFKQ